MKLKMLAMKDLKSNVYEKPFCVRTVADGIRAFEGVANDSNTQIGQFPADFALYVIGDYDDEKGMLTSISHESLGTASDFIKTQPTGE